ncbi:MAG: hypothetical protein AB7R69_03085 [Candidatus Babeliales bacterium]
MKQLCLITLFCTSLLTQSAEKSTKQEMPFPDLVGLFTIMKQHPVYAGYDTLDPFKINETLKHNFGRTIKANELLFKLISLPIHSCQEDTEEYDNEQEIWENAQIPSYVPYQELKELNEKESLFIKNKKEQTIQLILNTAALSKNPEETLSGNLHQLLKEEAKSFASYFPADEEKLVEAGIIKKIEQVNRFMHGPKGFFKKELQNPVAPHEPQVQLILLSQADKNSLQ